MEQRLESNMNLFVKNYNLLKEQIRFEDHRILMVCANLYSSQGRVVDVERIRQCVKLIKEKTGLFSSFKGIGKLAFATMLSLEEEIETAFDHIIAIYDSLRKTFRNSTYLPLVAYILSKVKEEERNAVIAKTGRIYDLMKQEHRFLTSDEDVSYAALFALSPLTEERAVREMEACYQILKKEFRNSNAVQSVSHVLALEEFESANSKCTHVIQMFQQLKEANHKFGTGYELAILAVLSLVSNDYNQTVRDLIEVNDTLKGYKGFGDWRLGRSERMMFSAMILENSYTTHTQSTMETVALGGLTSIILAEQAVMCACIAASMGAAAAANSNS